MVRSAAELDSALDGVPSLVARAPAIALFLDYDGTLTPIVEHPEHAVLAPEMRAVVRAAAAALPLVAVVSGRDREQVESLVGLDELAYVGSHGFDIAAPGGAIRHEVGHEHTAALGAAEASLRARLEAMPNARVERKRFSVATHVRQVPPEHWSVVAAIVERVRGEHGLRSERGKAVFELHPDVDWNKGRAVRWLLERWLRDRRGLADVLPIHLGDDATDESVFGALGADGVGIYVGDEVRPTAASLRLRDPADVLRFLRILVATVQRLRQRQEQQQQQ
jgi:trehalose 6-phosphate phosphatase